MKETLEYFVISLISSAVLIVISKIILDKMIRRNTDYYEKDERTAEEKMLSRAGLSRDGKESED